MKISRKALLSEAKITFNSIGEAVIDAATATPWSYEDVLEKHEEENKKLRELLSRLMTCIDLDNAQIMYILGYEYEVEE